MYFKGFYRAILDSWLMLIVLIFTCIAGTVGINFCYRILMFQFREPVTSIMYQDQIVTGYVMNSDNISISTDLLNNEKIVALLSNTKINIKDTEFDLMLVSEDYYGEKIIKDFTDGKKQIVLNKNIGYLIGEKIIIGAYNYEVVGYTEHTSYAPIFSFNKIDDRLSVVVDKQLTRGEISKLEKLTGADCKAYLEGEIIELSAEQYLFIVLGVFVLILTAFNLYRVFNEYIKSNDRRYNLYTMLGMSKARLAMHILCEGVTILIIGIGLSLIIDTYIFRPLVKITGYVYMYDILDILLSSLTMLLPFVLVLCIAIAKRVNKNARGVKEVKTKKRRDINE